VAILEGAATGHTPSGHQFAYRAHAYAQELKSRGVQIFFIWSPGYSNVYGNEIADQLAGQAALNPDQANTIVYASSWVWFRGFRKRIQPMQDLLKEWEERTNGLAYHHTPLLKPRESVLTLPMVEASITFQLRMGHGFMKATRNTSLTKRGGPGCCTCGKLETRDHILIHCRHYQRQRKQLFKNLSKCQNRTSDTYSEISTKNLLGDDMTIHLAKFVCKTKLHKRTWWHNQGGDSWHRHWEPKKMIKTRDLQVVKTLGDLKAKHLELKRKI
jgi:hypothetical protein